MKAMKKIAATSAAAIMALSMMAATSSFAAFAATSTYTITIDNAVDGHTYSAYQVFKGDLSGNVLTNITWGDGVNSDALLAALQADADFSGVTDAKSVAKKLEGKSKDDALAQKFADIVAANLSSTATASVDAGTTYTISGLESGYYFVKDTGATAAEDGVTKFLLKVVKDTTATPKNGTPTVEKKVKEGSMGSTDGGYGDGYNDIADYDIGDTVDFKLIGTLPEQYDYYKTYKYVFHDTTSNGLAVDVSTVKVYAYDGTAGNFDYDTTDKTDITANFTVDLTGNALTVSAADLKQIAAVTKDSKIVVEYTAKLDSDAVIGLNGNENEVYLEYSNNPNWNGSGVPGDTTITTEPTGDTPEDKVIVFTYTLKVTKEDADTHSKLSNAKFKLKAPDGRWAIVEYFWEDYKDKYKVTGWTDDEDAASVLSTGSDANVSHTDGTMYIVGLDEGEYELHETQAPDGGYNLPSNPFIIKITAGTAIDQAWGGEPSNALTDLSVTIDGVAGTADKSTGQADVTVGNDKGATLPETGGIGTKLFYVGGGAVVLASGVLLVAKKRMKKEAE